MADKGAQDKTEKPTPRRKQKARQQGQVAKSADMNSVAVLLAGVFSLWLMGGFLYTQLSDLMRFMWSNLGTVHMDMAQAHQLAVSVLDHFLVTVLPVWLAVFAAALAMNIVQVGFMLAPTRIKPDLKKINPLTGLKRFASLKLLVDLGKNIGKLVVVGGVAYLTFADEMDALPKLADMNTSSTMIYIVSVCFKIFWRSVLAMLVLALLDWAYQRYDFQKNLKMSKQEIKDEHKQTEGDPQVKSRIRSIQRDQARRRMMSDVPEADVVVTNPTHLAVALVYKMAEMDAPKVVAKGANRIAERIKALAKENDVPVIEDKPLAQALYKAVEVGDSIPSDLYEATATILAHVYRMKNKHRQFMRNQTGAAPAGD